MWGGGEGGGKGGRRGTCLVKERVVRHPSLGVALGERESGTPRCRHLRLCHLVDRLRTETQKTERSHITSLSIVRSENTKRPPPPPPPRIQYSNHKQSPPPPSQPTAGVQSRQNAASLLSLTARNTRFYIQSAKSPTYLLLATKSASTQPPNSNFNPSQFHSYFEYIQQNSRGGGGGGSHDLEPT